MSAMVCLYNLYSCAFPFLICFLTAHLLCRAVNYSFSYSIHMGCILSQVGSDLYVVFHIPI